MKLSTFGKITLTLITIFSITLLTSSKNKPDEKPRAKVQPIEIKVQPIKPVQPVQPNINELIDALIYVESKGNDQIIGDKHLGKNHSAGALQIRPVMVREVNRILKLQHKKKRYTLKDRFSRQKSIEMFNIWRQFHHPNDDFETIARNWNGGPQGYLKNGTVKYWVKVQLELNK